MKLLVNPVFRADGNQCQEFGQSQISGPEPERLSLKSRFCNLPVCAMGQSSPSPSAGPD